MVLEFVDDKQVRINDRTLKIFEFDPPFKDGTSHIVEATSDPTEAKYGQFLLVSDLSGLVGEMLPKGFRLAITSPEARTRGLNFASSENLINGPRLKVEIYLVFQDWEQRTNLYYFGNKLSLKVESAIERCQTAALSRAAEGINISCTFSIDASDDWFEVYSEVDQNLSKIYKQELLNEDQHFVQYLANEHPQFESNVRWWVRYVLVPILSGARVLRLLVGSLRAVKKPTKRLNRPQPRD